MAETRYLDAATTRELIDVDDAVDAVRDAYRQRGEGAPARPRTRLERRDPWGMVTGYSAILPETGVAGGYMYASGFADGDAWFVLPVFDAERGRLVGLLDGAAMNPTKTGAAGAVAADVLARDDAREAAILGSGRQAWGQLRCLARVRDLEAVRVFSPTEDHRSRFAEAARDELGPAARAVGSASEAVAGADVVVTATTSPDPVVADGDLPAGVHVTAMGQYHPDRREIEPATVARSTYVPDLRDRAFLDSGEWLGALEAGLVDETGVHAELGEVVAGTAPGRSLDDELTLFDSGGTAIETLAVAADLLETARERDAGRRLAWSSASEAMPTPWD